MHFKSIRTCVFVLCKEIASSKFSIRIEYDNRKRCCSVLNYVPYNRPIKNVYYIAFISKLGIFFCKKVDKIWNLDDLTVIKYVVFKIDQVGTYNKINLKLYVLTASVELCVFINCDVVRFENFKELPHVTLFNFE